MYSAMLLYQCTSVASVSPGKLPASCSSWELAAERAHPARLDQLVLRLRLGALLASAQDAVVLLGVHVHGLLLAHALAGQRHALLLPGRGCRHVCRGRSHALRVHCPCRLCASTCAPIKAQKLQAHGEERMGLCTLYSVSKDDARCMLLRARMEE